MNLPDPPPIDPFQKARQQDGVLQCPFHGELITMILRHGDVRTAANEWQDYSSDAPFRVPIPSEQDVRSVRQLPIETDPPIHTEYRAITEPFFQRAKDPHVIHSIKTMVDELVRNQLHSDDVDAIGDLVFPIQSKALTYLLNMPLAEADTWIDWGIHVFKVTGGPFKKADVLEQYLNDQLDRAECEPSHDFFSALVRARFQGRKLTRAECLGFGNLAFAGGRDTIIHTLTCILAYLADHPSALDYLRSDTSRITLASEEFFRVFMPLTQIGRVCTNDRVISGVEVKAGKRIGLCWVSANHDESVFDSPHEIRLDRRPNPHMSFGFRTHLCQGAAHARLVVRSLLESLCKHINKIEVIESDPHFEHESMYERLNGFDSLRVRFIPLRHEEIGHPLV